MCAAPSNLPNRSVAEEVGKLQAAGPFRQMRDALLVADAALGLKGPRPPAPLLWMRAGHPSLPASRDLFELESQMHALAGLLACGATWQEEDDAWPRALSASGVPPAESDPDGLAPALLASLAGHDQLRSELLTGLCLFRVAAYRTGSGGLDTAKAENVVTLLRERVTKIAGQVNLVTTSLSRLNTSYHIHLTPAAFVGSRRNSSSSLRAASHSAIHHPTSLGAHDFQPSACISGSAGAAAGAQPQPPSFCNTAYDPVHFAYMTTK